MDRTEIPAQSVDQKAAERSAWARAIFSTDPRSRATEYLEISAVVVAGLFVLAFVFMGLRNRPLIKHKAKFRVSSPSP
jgi:hypothetical protein